MGKVLSLILVLFFGINVWSQQPLRLRLTIWGNDSISTDKLVLGFDTRATNGLDTILGEIELPPLFPPGSFGVFGVFIFYDSVQKSNVWSYMDIRPFPENYEDTIKFLVLAKHDYGLKLGFEWRPIPEEYEYAWIVDEYLGTLFQVNMKEKTKASVDNEFLDKFYVKIKLQKSNSVEDKSYDNAFAVYPNPFDDYFAIQNLNSKEFRFSLYDVLGKEYLSGSTNSGVNTFFFFFLGKGIYYLQINCDGKTYVRKLIKL